MTKTERIYNNSDILRIVDISSHLRLSNKNNKVFVQKYNFSLSMKKLHILPLLTYQEEGLNILFV